MSLMASDPNQGNLSDTEQDLIRDYVRANLDGRFDFVLWREADTSDSEDDVSISICSMRLNFADR